MKLRANAGITKSKVRDKAPLIQALRATDDQLEFARLDPSDRHLAAFAMVRCTINVCILKTRQHVCLMSTLNYDESGLPELTQRRAELQVNIFGDMKDKEYANLENEAYEQLAAALVMQAESPCREKDSVDNGRGRRRLGDPKPSTVTAILTLQFLDNLGPDLEGLTRSGQLEEIIRRVIIEPRAWARQALIERLGEIVPGASGATKKGALLLGAIAEVAPWTGGDGLSADAMKVLFGRRPGFGATEFQATLAEEERRLGLMPGQLGVAEVIQTRSDVGPVDRRTGLPRQGPTTSFRFQHHESGDYFRMLNLTVPALAEAIEAVDAADRWNEVVRRARTSVRGRSRDGMV